MAQHINDDHTPSSNDHQALLIKSVSDNCLQEVVNIMSNCNPDVNCVDEHGMSPLQHACYKGNLQMVKYLIDQAADVNQNDHEHGYTALMFAALGGHASVLNLLLEHGANIYAVNSVGRNASQMAAFVGQHRSVAIINNFISRDFIEYYSKITGLEKQPRLSFRFIQPVHAFVRLVNVNPVRIAYFLKVNFFLFEEPKMISSTLDLLSEKLFRGSSDPKEMLSFKVHYLNFIFKNIHKFLVQSKSAKPALVTYKLDKLQIENMLNTLIKSWLKPNQKGFLETVDRLIRQSIRQYPYQENSLFLQLVQTLSTVEIGDEPSALSILNQAILGKGIEGDCAYCFACNELGPTKRCSRCKTATYCDHTCQKLHWHVHKHQCYQMALDNAEYEKMLTKKMSNEHNMSNENEANSVQVDTN